MVNGILVVRWDDKLGVVVEGMYPKALKISEDHIMRIFTTHAMGGGESSFMSMSIEKLFIASYYTGLPEEGKSQFYVALLLNESENADIYEEPLVEITPLLLTHVKDKYFDVYLQKQFQDIQKLTQMTEEQRYAMIHRDPRRVLVLRKLGLGVIPKDELRKWLSDQLGEEVLDIEGILSPFFKTQMIQILPVDTMDGKKVNCIFLIKDAFSMRSPVEKFYVEGKEGKAPPEMKPVFEIYRTNVETFFKEYKLSDEDSKQIAEIAADPSHYNLITILRNNYIELNQLPNIYEKDVNQIMPQINELIRHNIIDGIKDKRGNNWLFLKTDIVFPSFFPEYIVDSIRRRWMEKNITQNLALQHLELLKSVYKGEEEKFIRELGVPAKEAEEELPSARIPSKVPPKITPREAKAEVVATATATKVFTDEQMFNLIEQVNYLRKQAKVDLDNRDREAAYKKLQEAIKITKDLMAAGAVGQDKRLEKLEEVANSLKKLLGKEVKKEREEAPKIAPAIPIPVSAPASSPKTAADQQKILREQRDSAISAADKALTAGNFIEAVELLEQAAAYSEQMGEKDKSRDILKMANDIREKLKKLGK